MKVLILGDIHGRNFWRSYIEKYSNTVDKIVFLGDYLDPYPDEIENNPELMECNSFYDFEGLSKMLNDIIQLKKSNPEKYILLTGNHTDSYIFKDFYEASRTDYQNREKYIKIFKENINLFNFAYVQNNVIFSHAGITKNWAQEVWNELKFSGEFSIKKVAEFFQNASLENSDYTYLISYISYYRGGIENCGSLEWADIREHIDYPQNEVYQIFGHTQLIKPLIKDNFACLDCRKGFIFDTITHQFEDGSNSNL